MEKVVLFVATTNKLIAHPVIDVEQVVSVLACILDQFWGKRPEEGERKRERKGERKGEEGRGKEEGKGREGGRGKGEGKGEKGGGWERKGDIGKRREKKRERRSYFSFCKVVM